MARVKPRRGRVTLLACPDCHAETVPHYQLPECRSPARRSAVPRIVWVVIVCAVIALLFNLLLPLPHPWGTLLSVVLVLWVLYELLALAGFTPPGRR